MQIKKILSFLLGLFLLFAPLQSLQAQAAPKTQQQRVDYFNNLAGFFSTFFDLDHSFRFLTDDIFITNQCIKKDIFGLHSAKTQVSDYLLDNYLTITEAELEVQKQIYQSYSAELVFLRNLEILWNDQTNQFSPTNQALEELKNKVIQDSKVPSSNIQLLFPQWYATYSLKFNDYANCTNWAKLAEQARGLKKKATEIGILATNLQTSFLELGDTVFATPELFYLNTKNNLTYSVLNSYYKSKDNLLKDLDTVKKGLQGFVLDDKAFIQMVKQEQEKNIGTATSLGQTILGSSNLTDLPSAISQVVSNNATRQIYIQDQSKLMINSYFSDQSSLLLLQKLLDSNAEVTLANGTLLQENKGVLPLVRAVYKKQCSAG